MDTRKAWAGLMFNHLVFYTCLWGLGGPVKDWLLVEAMTLSVMAGSIFLVFLLADKE